MTDDTLLADTDREETLSWAYVRAIAGFAGYSISEENYDRDGIDLRIHAGGYMNPAIGIQLKATTRLGGVRPDGSYRYSLKIDNYRRLIRPSQVPRYLVVLALPEDTLEWLSVSDEELVMRRCGYWVSLLGKEPSANRSTVTVNIPAINRLDMDSLKKLLEDSRTLAQPDKEKE